MNNMVTLIGRLVKDLETKEINDKKVSWVTLAVPRNFKNEEGVYETDFFNITLYGIIAEQSSEICRKGDLMAIRGRLQTSNVVDDDGNIIAKAPEIIAEKVSFLSSKGSVSNED